MIAKKGLRKLYSQQPAQMILVNRTGWILLVWKEQWLESEERKKKKKTAKDSLQDTGKIKFNSAPETRVFGPPDLTEVSLNHWPCFLIRKYKGGKNCIILKKAMEL